VTVPYFEVETAEQKAGGWAGAYVGSEYFGAVGAYYGTMACPGWGTLIGGGLGAITGGIIGYAGGEHIVQELQHPSSGGVGIIDTTPRNEYGDPVQRNYYPQQPMMFFMPLLPL